MTFYTVPNGILLNCTPLMPQRYWNRHYWTDNSILSSKIIRCGHGTWWLGKSRYF